MRLAWVVLGRTLGEGGAGIIGICWPIVPQSSRKNTQNFLRLLKLETEVGGSSLAHHVKPLVPWSFLSLHPQGLWCEYWSVLAPTQEAYW